MTLVLRKQIPHAVDWRRATDASSVSSKIPHAQRARRTARGLSNDDDDDDDDATSTRKQRVLELTDPEPWVYMSEGRMNVVFAYDSSRGQRSSADDDDDDDDGGGGDRFLRGRVLRVPKRHIVAAATATDVCYGVSERDPRRKDDDEKGDALFRRNARFRRRVVGPLLGARHVDATDVPVRLSYLFVRDLRERALRDDRVPRSRRSEWRADDDDAGTKPTDGLDACRAASHEDLTRLPSTSNSRRRCGRRWSVGFEIKPKAGYVSASPLVRPEHRRAKWRHTRFAVFQTLLARGHVRKGWGAPGDDERSAYCPLDFFYLAENDEEEERRRVSRSVRALLERPRNNLKLWWNDDDADGPASLAHGHERVASEETSARILARLTGDDRPDDDRPDDDRSSRDALFDALVRVVTEILVRERDLRRDLLALQSEHDVLDADGAVLAHARLVELCGGDAEEARRAIDDDDDGAWWDETRTTGRFPEPPDCPALAALTDAVRAFRPRDVDDDAADAARAFAVERVRELDRDACVWSLRRWLLSLSACDASVLVTFGPPDDHDDNDHRDRTLSVRLANGVLVSFDRSVRVIDCDPKPAKKLETREKQEAVVALFEDDDDGLGGPRREEQ